MNPNEISQGAREAAIQESNRASVKPIGQFVHAYAQQQVEEKTRKMGEQLDHLLAHCKDSECEECSKIICPHNEPLHFHHDGCPSCVTFEQLQSELTTLREVAKELAEALQLCQNGMVKIAEGKGMTHEECFIVDGLTNKALTRYAAITGGK